ncbi:hypothetical protein LSAT2_025685 [Lamellibrachia satsuma]|nr:hypothetical protein LSAT2_025685 [Lamellibrachia satsuma]
MWLPKRARRKPTTTTTTTTPKAISTTSDGIPERWKISKISKISKFKELGVKLKNWALKKPTTQRSTPEKTGAAINAVDGLAYTCSVTKRQKDPWWMVDLQQVVLVYAVAVTNVTTEHKADVSIQLMNQRGKWRGVCDNFTGKLAKTQYVPCRRQRQARFELIHQMAGDSFISMHEVAVYGTPEASPG